jgi:hypothetical protein
MDSVFLWSHNLRIKIIITTNLLPSVPVNYVRYSAFDCHSRYRQNLTSNIQNRLNVSNIQDAYKLSEYFAKLDDR